MNKNGRIVPARFLLYLPVAIYLLSYLYLAFYHGKLYLISTVIHEGGIYTFLQTTLYASHFLGHIPVHTVLGLYFIGVYLCMSEMGPVVQSNKKGFTLLIGLLLFLAASWWISLELFGVSDTYSYILQQKQSVVRMEEGGSWNLHLPSTMMQFLLIPIFIYAVKILFRSKVSWSKEGFIFIGMAGVLCLVMTWLVNDNFFLAVSYVWINPRYLAHSVRELATFPLIYYPIPFYFLLKYSERSEKEWNMQKISKWMVVLGVIFIILFSYQAIIPLREGIGELAQKPSFAEEGELSIVYLLSSHYFEHFLDTVYFSLFCLTLFFFSQKPK